MLMMHEGLHIYQTQDFSLIVVDQKHCEFAVVFKICGFQTYFHTLKMIYLTQFQTTNKWLDIVFI